MEEGGKGKEEEACFVLRESVYVGGCVSQPVHV